MDTIQLKQLKVKIRELQRLLKEEDTNVIQDANKGVSMNKIDQGLMRNFSRYFTVTIIMIIQFLITVCYSRYQNE